MNLPEKRTSPLKIISATHINCFSVAIHCPVNPYSDVVLFLFLLLCIIVISAVKFDNFFFLQTYQLGRRVQIVIQRERRHVQVIIQMLNKPGLQVLLLATILVVWHAEAHCHAVMLFFVKECKVTPNLCGATCTYAIFFQPN